MTKVFNKRNAKRVTAILLAVVAVVSSIFNASHAAKPRVCRGDRRLPLDRNAAAPL